MIIFLRKIPASTKVNELYDFVLPTLKGGWFRKSGQIAHAQVLALRDKRTNAVEFHGLVFIEPDEIGLRTINRLKKRRFKGRLITIREYHQRSWHNDPRVDHLTAAQFQGRRNGDRRRGSDLEILHELAGQTSTKAYFVLNS